MLYYIMLNYKVITMQLYFIGYAENCTISLTSNTNYT